MIESKDISVVVQGAILKNETKKCLESIRKYLPESQIILSTWEGSNTDKLEYDNLILNKDPGAVRHDYAATNMHCCMNNFNRQLVSTLEGVKFAKRKYILKLRSDLTLKNSNFLKYWDKYSCQKEAYKLFNHRVLCSVIFSREYACTSGNGFPTPFHPSDFWFFGEREDIISYFDSCPLQTEQEAGNWIFKLPTRVPYTTALWRFSPEQNFCLNWVKKYYPDLEFYDWSDWNIKNIELSNNILFNNFVFLGYEQSGIFSKKHLHSEIVKNRISGLITYKYFQKCYKKYSDENYELKKDSVDYEAKLSKHLLLLIIPFYKFKAWISEVFSVLYYLFAYLISRAKRGFKYDR